MPKRRGMENKHTKNKRRRKRIIYSDSSNMEDTEITSDADLNVDNSTQDNPTGAELSTVQDYTQTQATVSDIVIEENESLLPVIPELAPEVLSALGDSVDNVPDYGEQNHPNLAQRWLPILRKGLDKDQKEQLLSEYKIPSSCTLLKAPTINPEIAIAITESLKARDKNLEIAQNQLGLGITAINRAMTLLLTGNDKLQVIKILSESSRILSDLHHARTEHRIKLLTPSLDKSFLNVIDNEERDATLFGKGLSEKIKIARSIEKQGLLIKKNVPVNLKPSSFQTNSRGRSQGNWPAPSHFPSIRRGWGGVRYNPMLTSQYATRRTLAQMPPITSGTSYRGSSASSHRYQQRAPRRR